MFLFEKICCEISEERDTFTAEECAGFSIFGDDAGVCVFEGGEEVAFGKDSALSAFSHGEKQLRFGLLHIAQETVTGVIRYTKKLVPPTRCIYILQSAGGYH